MPSEHQPHATTQTVKLEPELLVRLKIHAAMTCKTQQDILHMALVEYLERHDKNAPQQKGGKK
jgi:predicted transcriptional regulator